MKFFFINKLNVQFSDKMAYYTKFYSQKVLNNHNLSQQIKNILQSSFLKYSLDVGEGFLDFDTMTELQQYREVGLNVIIVSKDGTKMPLTSDEENEILLLESLQEENMSDDDDFVPELESVNLESLNLDEIAFMEAMNSEDQREAALQWIQNMDAYDFQERLKKGLLPDFDRDTENLPPLERTDAGFCRLMTDKELDTEEFNQGYLKRHLLRYMSLENFKNTYYEEFRPKLSIQETMRKIELETEAKVIQGYKSGDIKLPSMSSHPKDANKQLDFLKNIMAEGAKKFEAVAGRPMSYSEMREMFG